MILNKEKVVEAVNIVMGEMFYLSPDLDEQGRQKLEGATPTESIVIHIVISDTAILQMIYEWDLLQLMTANITALPHDELPKDWIRQSATEASTVIWGQYLTLNEKNSGNPNTMRLPQSAASRSNVNKARWHFNFCSESRSLNVSLIEVSH